MCFGQLACVPPLMPTFKIFKPLRFKPGQRSGSALRIKPEAKMAAPAPRRSARAAAAAEAAAAEAAKPKPISVEEIRGVTVTTWPDKILISEGMYTTARYAERIAAHGGVWLASEAAWHLPLPLAKGADVRFILSPAAKPLPWWVCCEKAKILSHKNQHYSCKEHTMYYEDCHDEFGNPIKILYSCSTCGGGPYTGT